MGKCAVMKCGQVVDQPAPSNLSTPDLHTITIAFDGMEIEVAICTSCYRRISGQTGGLSLVEVVDVS